MLALRSNPPALGPPLVTFAVLLVIALLVGTIGNGIVRRLSNPVGKYRLFFVGVLLPFTLLSYVLLAFLGFGPALAATLPVPTAGPAGALVAGFFDFLGAGLVGLAAYTPTIRGVRAVRDIDLSTRAAVVRMARYVLGVSVVLAVVILPLRLDATTSPVGFAVGLTLVVGVFLAGSPWILTAFRDTHTPTGETAARLDDLRARAGLDVRDVRVLDTDAEETANALVRGVPGFRRLFVTSTFLDRFDDDDAVSLLAVQAGRVRSRVLTKRAGTALVAAFPLVASVSGAAPRWPSLAVALGTVGIGFWLARRGVRAADEYAAERVGADVVAGALARYAEVHAMDPTRRRLPNPLSVNVALGDRIDRLRGRADG